MGRIIGIQIDAVTAGEEEEEVELPENPARAEEQQRAEEELEVEFKLEATI